MNSLNIPFNNGDKDIRTQQNFSKTNGIQEKSAGEKKISESIAGPLEVLNEGSSATGVPAAEILSKNLKAEAETSVEKSAEVDRILSKEEEMKRKSGEVWKCVDIDKDGNYLFRIEDQYNFLLTPHFHENYLRKQAEIFPAVEPPLSELLSLSRNFHADFEEYLHLNPDKEVSLELSFARLGELGLIPATAPTLSPILGYEIVVREGEWLLKLPSMDNLSATWKDLQKAIPDLPDLWIYESSGIAGDREFIEVFLQGYHALLSSDKEFVHDQLVHLYHAAISILEEKIHKHSKNYSELKNNFQIQVRDFLNKIDYIKANIHNTSLSIKDVEKIEGALSAAVDVWSGGDNQENKDFLFHFMTEEAWESREWQDYWKQKYPGDEGLDFEKLPAISLWIDAITLA